MASGSNGNSIEMKDKGILIFTFITATVGLLSYFGIKMNNKKLANQNAPDPLNANPLNNVATSIPVVDTGLSSSLPIKEGSHGIYVSELQSALGMPISEQDGIFGSHTLAQLQKITGLSQIDTTSQFNSIAGKTKVINKNTSRESLAHDLFNTAMSEKSMTGDYTLESLQNLRAYEADKILGIYIHTERRLTENPYDYNQYQNYENVRIVKIEAGGFMIMYDQDLKKYFYTSPYSWQVVSNNNVASSSSLLDSIF